MKLFYSTLLLCFLTIGVLAQSGSRVSGQLRDNGGVVRDQEIRLVSADKEYPAKTDERGNYLFESIPDGVYLLVYGNKKANVVIKNGQVKVSPLAEVVVVATGTTTPVSEVSKTVNVLSAQAIRNRNEFSLADALKTIPGFQVQQLGGFGRTATIKSRGLRNQDTAILIDGIRFRDPTAINGDASPFLGDLALTNVDRIEVLRGSGSSIYGTNAIGGVVDFQTARPKSGLNGSLNSEYGGLGLKRISGNIGDGTSNGKFGFLMGVSRTVLSEGIDGEDDAHNTNFQGRIDYDPFAKTSISGRLFVSDAFVRLNSGPDTLGNLPGISRIIQASEGVNFTSDVNDPDNYQYSKFFRGQIGLTQILRPNLVFRVSYQGLKTSRENENGSLGIGFQPFGGTETSVFDGQIHTLNSKFDWTTANNLLTFGYEFEKETYGNEGITQSTAGNFFTNAGQTSNTFFVQDLLGFFEDRLQLAGGFRLQHFSLDLPGFSVNNAPYNNLTLEDPPTAYTFDGSAAYYFPSSGTKIRAHAGNGYRVPSLYERFGTFYSSFSQDFTAIGDPELQPEKSIAFDGGIDQSFANNKFTFSATYFYTKLIDTVGYANTASDVGSTTRPFGGYFNTKGGVSRGAEFSGNANLFSSTSFFASYTYTNSDQRTSQVAGSGILKTLGIADHQFTMVATQRIGERLSLNFNLLVTSNYLAPIFSNSIFSTRIYRFDGHSKGDLTARYEHPAFDEKVRFVVFGTIENIFDSDYFENGFRTAGRTGRIGLGVRF
ncbi:MAG: TonB-dependent receptor plug domain-containing protein [Acidobacteria bacterium]|nr:TonB-dependent receptor plug domain-containing protein [Acidobacteriota bacterium]